MAKGRGEFDGKVFAQIGEPGGLVVCETVSCGRKLLGEFVKLGGGAGVADGGFGRGRLLGVVERFKPILSCAEMTVIERVGVHLHQDNDGVKC